MDQSYLGSRQKKWPFPLFLISIVIIGGVLFFLAMRRRELISPIPKQPSFEVVFYTPTPGAVTPTSTPSATPKVKATSAPSPKPTKTVIPSPTGKSPTAPVTVKPSPSITP